MKKTLFSILMILAFLPARSEIFLPKIFSDNMVLQRQMPVKIWGKAEPNANVGIEFLGQKIETKAKKDGSWVTNLRPMKVNGTPTLMKIYENGVVSKELKNILVGEVWVAGGQSNMEWTLSQINMLKNDSLRGEKPMIRMFTQQKDAASNTPEFDSPEGAMWEVCTSQNFRDFSAISFYFAEDLSSRLKVPVGIVQTSLGGAKMSPWLADEDMENNPFFAKDLAEFNALNEEYNYEEVKAIWDEKVKKITEAKKQKGKANKSKQLKLPKEPSPFTPTTLQKTPSLLYNAKIAPIAGYTARGFIWYQGESDLGDVENFSGKFETLIKSWRKYWDKAMPFYFVQLPSYGNAKEGWVEARWQQYLTKQKLRLVEMAVSIDTGEEKSIHPSDKEEISKRLARIADKKIYNNRFMTGEYGPMLKNSIYDENTVTLVFNLYGRKFKAKGAPRGFEILVGDEWQAPEKIEFNPEKSNLKLIAPAEAEIKAVRYLWKAWAKPDVYLYNDLDMPAMGFISDKKDSAPALKSTPPPSFNRKSDKKAYMISTPSKLPAKKLAQSKSPAKKFTPNKKSLRAVDEKRQVPEIKAEQVEIEENNKAEKLNKENLTDENL